MQSLSKLLHWLTECLTVWKRSFHTSHPDLTDGIICNSTIKEKEQPDNKKGQVFCRQREIHYCFKWEEKPTCRAVISSCHVGALHLKYWLG